MLAPARPHRFRSVLVCRNRTVYRMTVSFSLPLYSLLTVPLLQFATQMLAPSKQTPMGLVPAV